MHLRSLLEGFHQISNNQNCILNAGTHSTNSGFSFFLVEKAFYFVELLILNLTRRLLFQELLGKYTQVLQMMYLMFQYKTFQF